MGELTSRERLQPSLLDRLSDDDREQVDELQRRAGTFGLDGRA